MKRPLNFRERVLLVIVVVIAAAWFLLGCAGGPGGRKFFVPVATNQQGAVTYQVNPGLTNAIGTGQEIGEQLGAPWGTIITGVLGVTNAVLGVLLKRKNDQASVVPALVAGIELAKNNGEVKTSIQRIATATGVEKRLNKLVHKTDADDAAKHFGK